MAWLNIEKGEDFDITGANLRANLNTISATTVNIYDDGESTLLNATNIFTALSSTQYLNLSEMNLFNSTVKCNYSYKFISNTIQDISGLETLNPSKVNLYYMFYNCANLKNVSGLDLGQYSDLSLTFYNCFNLTDSVFNNTTNLDKAVNLGNTFMNCKNLTTFPFNYFPNASNMTYICYGCNNISGHLYLNCPNLHGTSDAGASFIGTNISSLDLDWIVDFGSSTSYARVQGFSHCYNLTDVNANIYCTSNSMDVGSLFFNCYNLVNVNMNFHNIARAGSLFSNCQKLTIENYYFDKISSLDGCFKNCKNIKHLNITTNTTSKCTIDTAFANMDNVLTITFPANVGYISSAFANDFNLTSVDIGNILCTYYGGDGLGWAFYECRNLQYINCDTMQLTTISLYINNVKNMFYNCNNLSAETIDKVINGMLNANIYNKNTYSNCLYNLNNANINSIFYGTNIDNSRYSARIEELSAKGFYW